MHTRDLLALAMLLSVGISAAGLDGNAECAHPSVQLLQSDLTLSEALIDKEVKADEILNATENQGYEEETFDATDIDEIHDTGATDTLLAEYFCQNYYPNDEVAQGLPPCAAVRAAVISNMTRTLPTLELGDPQKPALFFIHGWPDSAAVFAAQFGGFCFGPHATHRCVAPTWQNYHPDLPNAPMEDLKFTVTLDRLASTMREAQLLDTTLVIHDFGSPLGYQLMALHPDLMKRTISFDIGEGGHPNITYTKVNAEGYLLRRSKMVQSSAEYWGAPCVACATWRTAWPYVIALSLRGLDVKPTPNTMPLLFIYGNMTRGEPRGPDSEAYDDNWFKFVESCPHGKVVEALGDHWFFRESARFVNGVMAKWLLSL